MGIITMGVPEDATLFIKHNFNCDVFVETGTYLGNTAIWAAGNFKKVYTIEFSKSLFESTSKEHAHIENIDFCFGDTRTVLGEILVKNHGQNLIFWLDAHWSAGSTYGENDQCPIIDELHVLNTFDGDCFILIDDARLFMAPPPLPHNLAQYPDLKQLISKLAEKERFIAIYDDVIFAVPAKYKPNFQQFFQSKVTSDLHIDDVLKPVPLTKKIVQKIKKKLFS